MPEPLPSTVSHEPTPEAVRGGFWATCLEALSGTKQDLTAIPVARAVLLLSVPMVLEMSMESLFAIVDIFFVSRLGSDAVATVGLTESMFSFVYAIAMGLSAGTTAIVARKVGEKDAEGAAAAAAQVIFLALVISGAIGVVGTVFASDLLAAMGSTPSMIETGARFTAIMFAGSATVLLLFVVNAIFRSSGDAAVAMRSLWLANGLNIVLAPCLIFGVGPVPAMGVAGAAIATTLSRGVGVAYQFVMLWRGRGRLTLKARYFVPCPRTLREICRLSGAASLQIIIETASWLGLVRIVSVYGSAVLAGYTIAMRIAIFALLPSWGLANAAATLVGQNLGAGEPERAQRSVSTVAKYNVVFLGIVSILFAFSAHLLVRQFASDPQVIAHGSECLRIVAVGFVCFGYGLIAVQAFNGAGDTLTPMLVNLGAFWFVKIPLAYVLASVVGMGPRGTFFAITVAYTVQAVLGGLLFRRGRWKRTKIFAG